MSMEEEKQRVEKAALQALYGVADPELGMNVVDLGLVIGVAFDQGELSLRYRLTSATCPVGSMVANAMDDALRSVPGVEATLLYREDDPPWSADCISPEGRKAMGF